MGCIWFVKLRLCAPQKWEKKNENSHKYHKWNDPKKNHLPHFHLVRVCFSLRLEFKAAMVIHFSNPCRTANQRYSQHEGGAIDAPFWKSSWWILVKFLGRSERRLKILEMSPGKNGGIFSWKHAPRNQLLQSLKMGRAHLRKMIIFQALIFRTLLVLASGGVYTVMIVFFLRPPAQKK